MNLNMLHLKVNPQRTTSNILDTMNSIKLSSQVTAAASAAPCALANHISSNITLVTSNVAINGSNKIKNTKKSVRFSELCKVILIPMRHEYSAAGIYLWWTKQDFLTFRQGYIAEKRNEKAAAAALLSTPSSKIGSLTNPPESVGGAPHSVLVVTNQTNSHELITRISTLITSRPVFTILTHEEVAQLASNSMKYDTVIIDGTDDCQCYELNSICTIHSTNRLSTINTIRSLAISSNITLFVNNSTIDKESIKQLCDVLPSDLMILTPDSWTDFQQLIQSAQSFISDQRKSSSIQS